MRKKQVLALMMSVVNHRIRHLAALASAQQQNSQTIPLCGY